jgi:hypothetical protein
LPGLRAELHSFLTRLKNATIPLADARGSVTIDGGAATKSIPLLAGRQGILERRLPIPRIQTGYGTDRLKGRK